MILEIRINGQSIDLAPQANVTWERISPYFVYNDIFSDSVEIPLVPLTSKNRAIFQYIDIVNLGSKHPRFTFEKYVNGQMIQEGTAFVSDVDQNGFKINVVQRLNEFFGDYHNQVLTQIDLGTISLPEPLLPALIDSNGDTAAVFPTIINTDFYSDKGSEVNFTGIVNEYESGAYLSGPKTPMPFVGWLLKRIGQVCGVTMTGDFFTDPFCQRLIHYNTRALDQDTVMTINRHLPDMTPAAYVMELRKLLNLSLDFNTVTKTLKIGFTDDIMAGPTTLDWSDKLVKGSKKLIERNRRLQLSMTLDGSDALMKDKPLILDDYLTPEFADDLGIAPVKTVFSTLAVDSSSALPTAKQPGTTILFNMLTNKSAPRLLLWHGADPEDDVPVALPYWDGKSLYWNGAKGLKSMLWDKTENVRKNICYLSCELTLNEYDLAAFDFKKKIHINGMDYLPLQIDNSFPLQKPTKAVLVQV
jgi:hypothetical protein